MGKTFFVDFDGTITKNDTCEAMVKAFARDGWQEINRLWEEKKLSTEDCANMTFKLFDADVDDVLKLANTIEIDDYFLEFISVCYSRDYKIYILSDGYDLLIKTILERYNINIPYYANKLVYEEGFRIECPYHNKSCSSCGVCKTGLMQKLKEEGNETIYIGDGYSDTCPSMNADIVFAKGSLYRYCMDKRIDAEHYNNFKDIISLV